jgi:AraC-like DNA-binding protein
MFINAEVRTYGSHGMRHEHPFAQLIVPLDGTMEIEVEGRGDCLTPSLFCALDVGMAHDFRAVSNGHFLIFDVSEQVLAEHHDVTRSLPFRQRIRAIDPRALRFLRSYARELQEGLPGEALPELARRLLALAGLALLAECRAPSGPRRHAARMASAARWIEDHAASGGAMAELAPCFGLSHSHFRALFRRELGRSPKQHEMDARLTRAAELLLGSPKSVSEIAFEVGYSNVSSFTRSFTRRYATTPSRFRSGRK